MYAAIRVSDCRPLPPTPTKRAWARGCLMIREIRHTCSIANLQKNKLSAHTCSPYQIRNTKSMQLLIQCMQSGPNEVHSITYTVVKLKPTYFVIQADHKLWREISSLLAHLNMTRFMGFLLTLLYSSRKFSTTSRSLFTSNTSIYGLLSFLGSTKSQNMRLRRSSSSTTPVRMCVCVCVGGWV